MVAQIALAALFLWFIQIALSYRQARIFYKRISTLRKRGPCATGLAGGHFRGRVYVVLVAHPTSHNIIVAEQLKGFTVFATLKPIIQLEGVSLETLTNLETPPIQGIPPKVLEAARSAAEAIQTSLNKVPTAV
jgi:glucitol operon activator protein